jgi:DNA-binding NarL/FixJ family response regulator
MKNETSILIAEDHHLVAKLLSVNLESIDEFHVIGVTYDGEETLKKIAENKPDILLLDIDMPVIDGMQVLKEIRKNDKNMKIIIVSNHTESWLIKMSLLQGADGFITKFAESDELIDAIRNVMNNKKYLCKVSKNNLQLDIESAEDLKKSQEEERSSFTARFHRLSKREKQIFKLIINGHTSKEIAEKLYISVRTAETHRKNILQKMEMRSSVDLIREAIATGLFQDENFQA